MPINNHADIPSEVGGTKQVHFPRDFDSAPIGSQVVKNFLGDVSWITEFALEPVLDVVDITAAPPTEVHGDRYLLDGTGGGDAGWDGASDNSIVEYDSSSDLWIEFTPTESDYVDDKTDNELLRFDGTDWNAINATAAAFTGEQGIDIDGSNVITFAPVTVVTGTTVSMEVNNAYVMNNAGAITGTMPATSSVGDIIQIIGLGAGGWRISPAGGATAENIHINKIATGTGGAHNILSTNQFDVLTIRCVVAGSGTGGVWQAVGGSGTYQIVDNSAVANFAGLKHERFISETVTRAAASVSATETRGSIAGQVIAAWAQGSDDAQLDVVSWGISDPAGTTNHTVMWADSTGGGGAGDVVTHNRSFSIYVNDGGNGWSAIIEPGIQGSYDIVWTKLGSGLAVTVEIYLLLA